MTQQLWLFVFFLLVSMGFTTVYSSTAKPIDSTTKQRNDKANDPKEQSTSIEILEKKYQRIGAGKLTWFGFSVYRSALFTESGEFSGVKTERPLMLVIQYQRDIDKSDLIARTYKEWKRLPHYEEKQFSVWRADLERIWPEIKENDRLACVIEADGSTSFYGNEGLLGRIQDKEFGWNFISIWLAETTSEKSLRKKLLGID